nr:hypothetical protein KitaXyl93_65500 [Kitasatospora sp. Xyl93]
MVAVAAQKPAEAATRATAEPIAVAVRRERGFRGFVVEVMTIPRVGDGPASRGAGAEVPAVGRGGSVVGEGEAGGASAPECAAAPEQHGACRLTSVAVGR